LFPNITKVRIWINHQSAHSRAFKLFSQKTRIAASRAASSHRFFRITKRLPAESSADLRAIARRLKDKLQPA
jgi:hypothetical protein